MVEAKIGASLRPSTKGSYRHYLRDNGRIPAVVYGKGIKGQAIELDAKDLESVIRQKGRNVLIDLDVTGGSEQKKYVVMIKDLQRDPIRRDIVHADLCKVSLEEKLRTTVPLVLKGEAAGKKTGGVLQTGLRELEIECTPDKMPDAVNVDISSLETGQHITVADLLVFGEFKILTEPDKMVVMVAAPRVAEEKEEDTVRDAETAEAETEAETEDAEVS
ncbi:50S ribosomal protein L25/general stress protein Ctc [Phosphitispora fastidiosa]|uniref:50S ribosomal protein L25/general stress protein Ctc n=1 Tax=Phosphitispora fastidiosa TaxID=2837202 RepID=UPI001E2F9818|nr:50S ribosomal protein L25/general stress protein Ctc [Phosphitispora fastidiosa]MBU7007789.1 large subunit ribosomal protein L25 [Phosphitispora fastidiosa]